MTLEQLLNRGNDLVISGFRILHYAVLCVVVYECDASVLLFPAEGSEQWRTQEDGAGPALYLCGKPAHLWLFCSLCPLGGFALFVLFAFSHRV